MCDYRGHDFNLQHATERACANGRLLPVLPDSKEENFPCPICDPKGAVDAYTNEYLNRRYSKREALESARAMVAVLRKNHGAESA